MGTNKEEVKGKIPARIGRYGDTCELNDGGERSWNSSLGEIASFYPSTYDDEAFVKELIRRYNEDFDLRRRLREAEVRAEDAERRLKPFKVNFQKVAKLVHAARKAEEAALKHWQDDEARVAFPVKELLALRKAAAALAPITEGLHSKRGRG